MDTIKRANCAITGSNDIEELWTFSNFPVFMGCVSNNISDDLLSDMKWGISVSSGLIQLTELLPLELLYPESHGSGTVGSLWQLHHEAFAAYIDLVSPTSVLEIGGGHGILASMYSKLKEISWTIIEPNPSPVEGCSARFVSEFFDGNFKSDIEIDTVVHSHLFEHLYAPDEFMNNLAKFMKPGRNLIFSVPNMRVMLEKMYTNCINFEHTIFLTEEYIDYLLRKHGFEIVDKKYFLDDHSIFYRAVRVPLNVKVSLPDGLYRRNKNIYLKYIEYHQQLISKFNELLNRTNDNVYLFGAHVFSQYLIAFGLNTDKIECILDNDPKKHGKRLSGTNLFVKSPQAIQDQSSPNIILKAGVYNEEIKSQILTTINSNAVFIE